MTREAPLVFAKGLCFPSLSPARGELTKLLDCRATCLLIAELSVANWLHIRAFSVGKRECSNTQQLQ